MEERLKFSQIWQEKNKLCADGEILNHLQQMLTRFMPLISFDTPWKHQKTSDFLMFVLS